MNIIWTLLYNIHPGHFLKTFPYHMVHHRKRSSSGTWSPWFMYRQEASAIVYCQSVWCLIIIHDAALSGPLGFASDVIFLLFCNRSSSAAASLDTAALSLDFCITGLRTLKTFLSLSCSIAACKFILLPPKPRPTCFIRKECIQC